MRKARDLPNDVEALKRLILEQQALIDSHALEIERLRVQLDQLRRLRYGRSSEKLDQQIAQLELTLEDWRAWQAPPTQTCWRRRVPHPSARCAMRWPNICRAS